MENTFLMDIETEQKSCKMSSLIRPDWLVTKFALMELKLPGAQTKQTWSKPTTQHLLQKPVLYKANVASILCTVTTT